MPSLKMLRGPEPGRIYELNEDTVTIGRGRRNEVIIHDNEVSREHCRLVKVLFDYEIHDLESTNGTYLNGRPVGNAATPIFDKNIIELGDGIVLEYIVSREAMPILEPAPSAIPVVVKTPVINDYYLVMRRKGQLLPEVYLLDSPVVDIGRNLDNTICLVENQVSRFHMRLSRMDDYYTVEDLGSVNGTTVNGKRIDKPVDLKSGDYIAIGQMVEIWYTNDLETLQMIPYSVEQAAAASKKTEEFKTSMIAAAIADNTLTKESSNVVAKSTSEVSVVDAPTDQVPRRELPKVETPEPPPAPETTLLDADKVNLPIPAPSKPSGWLGPKPPDAQPTAQPIFLNPNAASSVTPKPPQPALTQNVDPTMMVKPVSVPLVTPTMPVVLPPVALPETPTPVPTVQETLETFAATPLIMPPAPEADVSLPVPETRRFAAPKSLITPVAPSRSNEKQSDEEVKLQLQETGAVRVVSTDDLPPTKEVPTASPEVPASSESSDLVEPKE